MDTKTLAVLFVVVPPVFFVIWTAAAIKLWRENHDTQNDASATERD